MAYRFFKRFKRDQRGTLTAELSIVLPVLLFLLLVPMVLNLAVWAKIVVIDAAREGARYQALRLGDPSYIVNETLIDGRLKPDNVDQVNVSEGQAYATVEVRYNQPSIVPGAGALFGGSLFGDTIPLSSKSVFKIEQ